MQFTTGHDGAQADIARLFADTFTASEGADEGALIGALVTRLLDTTPPQDIVALSAHDGPDRVGVLLFTRLRYADPRRVMLMAPVAVRTDRQGAGIGQHLIAHGLNSLRQVGADMVLTYGDPAYYSRAGFQPITQDAVPAPYPLQMPHGWQGQSLTDAPLTPLPGPCTCVPGFADPALW